jgi:hypothetical protein
MILSDRRRNIAAMSLIRSFSDGVDSVRERQLKAKGSRADQRVFGSYLMLVQQATDNLAQRKGRAEILRRLLAGLFERKEERRVFTPKQRRLLWNSDEKKCCVECRTVLDWNNF